MTKSLWQLVWDACYPSLDSNAEAPIFMGEIQNSSVFAKSASLIPHNPFVSTGIVGKKDSQ